MKIPNRKITSLTLSQTPNYHNRTPWSSPRNPSPQSNILIFLWNIISPIIYIYTRNNTRKKPWNKKKKRKRGKERKQRKTKARLVSSYSCRALFDRPAAYIARKRLTAIDLHYADWLASSRAAYSTTYTRVHARLHQEDPLRRPMITYYSPLDTRIETNKYFIIRRNRPRRAGRKI